MKLKELIEQLQEVADQHGDDHEVIVADQSNDLASVHAVDFRNSEVVIELYIWLPL